MTVARRPPPESPLSLHWLVEAHRCDRRRLRDLARLESLVEEVCRTGRWSVKATHFFRYGNGGVTGLAVLAESHFSLHTWPEFGYAAIDVFVCRPRRKALQQAVELALSGLGARAWTITEVERGVRSPEVSAPLVATWEGPAGA